MSNANKNFRRYVDVMTIPPCGISHPAAMMPLMCVLFVRVPRSQDALSFREGA